VTQGTSTDDRPQTGITVYPPSAATDLRLENNFTYHAPKGDQARRYEEIRDMGRSLAHLMTRRCPESRELSLALTKLEEAVMWANAAIARNE
jgi:hypothetical protein